MITLKICKDHIIGIWHDYGDSELVTYNDLINKVAELHNVYKELNSLPDDEYINFSTFYLKDYLDKRKSSNFELFNFCPMCGTKINVKTIKLNSN